MYSFLIDCWVITMNTIWLILGLVVATQTSTVKYLNDVPKELEWPKKYSLKAERMSLTDDITENYEMWRTPSKSRIDYNNGYVKSIVKYVKSKHLHIKYSIHPVATIDQKKGTKCTGAYDPDLEVETILPEDLYGYEVVDNETINYKETVKFSIDFIDGTKKSRNTIWAFYNDTEEVWHPVKYEVLEFNYWLGSKDKHEVWNFYDFTTPSSFAEVFDTTSYDCKTEEPIEISEAFSKNMLFANPDKDRHVDHMFERFKKDFSKKYFHENEHLKRRSIFKRNMRYVISHNRRNLGYKLALNHFADKTPKEVSKYLGLKRRPAGKVGTVPFPYDEAKLKGMDDVLPTEYDARVLGLVSEVKNQENCGSCWTYGTTAAVEGALARINGGRLLALSNQALIDCAWAFGGNGCDGGSDNAAYEWMMEYGLPTEAEYGTYLNRDGICNIHNMTKLYPIRGYTDVTPTNIVATKIALVNHGPLSVSIHATRDVQLYSSGILYDINCDPQKLDHEVTLVGYGEQDGETFWIIKNSWGSNWGVGGYMFISARDNNCGITTEPTYVVF